MSTQGVYRIEKAFREQLANVVEYLDSRFLVTDVGNGDNELIYFISDEAGNMVEVDVYIKAENVA